jgi:uncharacterized protein YjbI with pentapeptide repeats
MVNRDVVPGARVSTAFADVVEIRGTKEFRGVKWKSLDFSRSDLRHLRFFDCVLDDCVFDDCQCRAWRLWGTTIENSSFRSANLRDSALGPVFNSVRNSFKRVDFTDADLRGTAYQAAEFVGCSFKNSRLKKVDFQSSSFTDCVFEGVLEEVCFYRRGFRGEAFPPNEMLRVDLSHAQLRSVEFRGLDLDQVSFPLDADHIIIDDYRQTLDHVLEALRNENEKSRRGLTAYLGVFRKWAGERQRRGVLNKRDIIEIAGEDGLAELLTLIARSRR